MRRGFVNETKGPPSASNELNLVRSSLIAPLYEGMNEEEDRKKEKRREERALCRVTHRLSNRQRRPSRA